VLFVLLWTPIKKANENGGRQDNRTAAEGDGPVSTLMQLQQYPYTSSLPRQRRMKFELNSGLGFVLFGLL